MKEFARLIKQLDSTNSTNNKVRYLSAYFLSATSKDKLWTIALLSHRRPRRPVSTTKLREWASDLASIPLWLFEESYHIVGDLAETIALVVPQQEGSTHKAKALHERMNELTVLAKKTESEQRQYLETAWQEFDPYERFAFTKLLTGGFRIGISQKLMTRALAQATGQEEDVLAFKLMGNWTPDTTTFEKLVFSGQEEAEKSKPYPFYLAHPLEEDPESLGTTQDWFVEYKWDGIRAQVVCRGGEVFIWSRGEELITDKFPELQELAGHLPEGVVIDGELLARKEQGIGSFNDLQKRLGRKTVSKKLLKEHPVFLKAYDLLEWEGKDIRELPLKERRTYLESLFSKPAGSLLELSPLLEFNTWKEAARLREQAREEKSEGLMLKRKSAPYGVGRKKGDWWKWKVDPLTIDAVLTYAMRGHGRRTNLFTDYTFALWNGEELVTFAKAYSGLSDAEFREADRFIKKNTLERFGPVRRVKPELVFEIAFEGIAPSSRHKSGIAVRFPRILRWRKDKKPEEANTLNDLKALL